MENFVFINQFAVASTCVTNTCLFSLLLVYSFLFFVFCRWECPTRWTMMMRSLFKRYRSTEVIPSCQQPNHVVTLLHILHVYVCMCVHVCACVRARVRAYILLETKHWAFLPVLPVFVHNVHVYHIMYICLGVSRKVILQICSVLYILPWPKKRTILEIRGEKNAVPRVISCSIRRDQRRAKVADSRGLDLPCADRAWSSMISHVEQRSSRRESRWFFFWPG